MNNRMLNTFGQAAGLGSIGAGLGSLFGNSGENPYQAAAPYFNRIPQTIKPYFEPYMNAGREAMGTLQHQYGHLINDPTAIMNKIGAGYQRSPGYDFQMQQGMNAANNAAGAGGMLGSPMHQFNASQFASGLANQDYYNYLNHGLQQYGLGLSGEQGLNQMGYNASNELAGALSNNLMNQGNLAFSGAAAQNQSQGTGWGNILGGVGSLLAFL